MSNYMDIFPEKPNRIKEAELIEAAENINFNSQKLEFYNKTTDIVRDIIDIVKIKIITQREIALIQEKTEKIKELTDGYVRKIQSEGDKFVKEIEALKGLLDTLERVLRESDLNSEHKELILRIIYEKIKQGQQIERLEIS